MTDDDTARLRALASAASIGPWSVHGNNCDEWYVYALHARYETLPGNSSPVKVAWVPWSPGTLRHEHDAAYIAAASPDVLLRLLDALDEARRERDDLGAKLVDAINLAATRTGERDAAVALLREARTALRYWSNHEYWSATDEDTIARIDALLGGGGGDMHSCAGHTQKD